MSEMRKWAVEMEKRVESLEGKLNELTALVNAVAITTLEHTAELRADASPSLEEGDDGWTLTVDSSVPIGEVHIRPGMVLAVRTVHGLTARDLVEDDLMAEAADALRLPLPPEREACSTCTEGQPPYFCRECVHKREEGLRGALEREAEAEDDELEVRALERGEVAFGNDENGLVYVRMAHQMDVFYGLGDTFEQALRDAERREWKPRKFIDDGSDEEGWTPGPDREADGGPETMERAWNYREAEIRADERRKVRKEVRAEDPSEPVLWQIEVLDAEGVYWEEYESRETAESIVLAHLDGDPSEMGRTTGRIRALRPDEPIDITKGDDDGE